jgi:hypothetical protein
VLPALAQLRQLRHQVQAILHELAHAGTTACADMGYCSPADLQQSLAQGVDVIVPILRHSDFRDQFVYDAAQDVYRCSEGHVLRYVGDHQRYKYRAYQADATQCQCCPQFGHCITSRSGRRIARPFTEHIRERLEHSCSSGNTPLSLLYQSRHIPIFTWAAGFMGQM